MTTARERATSADPCEEALTRETDAILARVLTDLQENLEDKLAETLLTKNAGQERNAIPKTTLKKAADKYHKAHDKYREKAIANMTQD